MPGQAFAGWTFDYVEFDNNACTSCHRMPDFRRFTAASHIDYNAHMPPLAPGSMKADFEAVGPVTGGKLTLTKAGTQTGDAVEGSFAFTWK